MQHAIKIGRSPSLERALSGPVTCHIYLKRARIQTWEAEKGAISLESNAVGYALDFGYHTYKVIQRCGGAEIVSMSAHRHRLYGGWQLWSDIVH